MNFPLVSVCIPTYNNPVSLKRCLESVIKQTYVAIEIVITDDSTNEDTSNLVNQSFPQAFIRYIRNSKPLGSPANWNEAIRLAKGQYIKILHHDDWLANENVIALFVNEALKYPNKPTLFFCTSIKNVFEKKQLVSPNFFFLRKLKEYPSSILYTNGIGGPSVCFFENIAFPRFDEGLRWYVDVIFYYQFLQQKNSQLVFLPLPLVNITAGSETQLTHIISNIEKFSEAIYCIRKYIDLEFEAKRLVFKVTFIELLLRHNINSSEWEGFKFNNEEQISLYKLFKISRLPIPRKFYTICRKILLG